jgi:outer membrane protein assembly factor BamD (BamD/ComL family)
VVAVQAQLDLGEVELMRDNLAAARTAFSRVEESERIGEQAELARLELARLDFYEGQFDMAKTRAQAMNRNTATDVANDAIALKLLVSENTGPDSMNAPLRTFARAQLLQRQQRPGLALAVVDSLIAAYPQHALGDEAHFLRAEVLRDLSRSDDALAVLRAFPDRFPDSYLIDRSLFIVGEIHERDRADPQAAISAYADLLARYPGSLLVPEARARIRQLRGDGV